MNNLKNQIIGAVKQKTNILWVLTIFGSYLLIKFETSNMYINANTGCVRLCFTCGCVKRIVYKNSSKYVSTECNVFRISLMPFYGVNKLINSYKAPYWD